MEPKVGWLMMVVVAAVAEAVMVVAEVAEDCEVEGSRNYQ